MSTTFRKRIGIIGVGEISDWHVRALRIAGLEVSAAASRPGSTRLASFAERHGIPRIYPHWGAMLEDGTSWDGLVVATHVDGTAEVLREALPLGRPILVEKPVAHEADQIGALLPLVRGPVLVAYNRRYYRTTRLAKEFVAAGEPLLAQLVIPEGIDSTTRDDGRSYLFPFFDNTPHAIDLARYLFGALEVQLVRRVIRSGSLAGFGATFESRRGDVLQVLGNWGTPSNFALTLDRPGIRFELRPFEVATIYDGMDVVPASEECPIRRYIPKMQQQVVLDDMDHREKPGFVGQAREFAAVMEGKGAIIGATLSDASEVMQICQQIVADS